MPGQRRKSAAGSSSPPEASCARPEPPAATSAPVAASASASPSGLRSEPALVRLNDRRVFSVEAPLAGKTPAQRATAASRALETAAEEYGPDDVRLEEQGDVFVVYAGKVPIVNVTAADALASGAASTRVHAEAVASRLRDALRNERRRQTISSYALSVSLIAFVILAGLFIARRLRELLDRALKWLENYPDTMPALRVADVEVLHPTTVRAIAGVSLRAAKVTSQLVLLYVGLLVASAVFEPTRRFSAQLGWIVWSPIAAFAARSVNAFPTILLAGLALIVLAFVVRISGVAFRNIARGETSASWIPRERAIAVGQVLRGALVVVAVLLAAPLLGDVPDGPVGRIGQGVVWALAFACAPAFANFIAGLPIVFGQAIQEGMRIRIAGTTGVVERLSLVAVFLKANDGRLVRIPNLMTLVWPMIVEPEGAVAVVEIEVTDAQPPQSVVEVLRAATAFIDADACVTIVGLREGASSYRVSLRSSLVDLGNVLVVACAGALDAQGLHASRIERVEQSP